MQVDDKRSYAWRLAGDSYGGVIGLIGSREGDEEDEETCNDSDGRGEIFHKCVFLWELIFDKTAGSSQRRSSCVQQRISINAFLMIKQATQPELAFLGVLLVRERDGGGGPCSIKINFAWLASDILYGLAKPISARKQFQRYRWTT